MLEKLLKIVLLSFGNRNFEGSKKKNLQNLRESVDLEILSLLA